jgi:hypothetical protein
VRDIAKRFAVPHTTLRRHVAAQRDGKPRPKVGRRPWLSEADEEEMVQWVETVGPQGAPPSGTELRVQAAAIAASRAGRKYAPGVIAGQRWLDGFMKRYCSRIFLTRFRPSSRKLPTPEQWGVFFDCVLVNPLPTPFLTPAPPPPASPAPSPAPQSSPPSTFMFA